MKGTLSALSSKLTAASTPVGRAIDHFFDLAFLRVLRGDSFDCLFLFKEHSHHRDAALHRVHGGKDWR